MMAAWMLAWSLYSAVVHKAGRVLRRLPSAPQGDNETVGEREETFSGHLRAVQGRSTFYGVAVVKVSRRVLLLSAAGLPLFSRAASLQSMIANAKPSVVAVGLYSELQSPRFAFSGSGFAFGNGSTVATCAHVVPPNRTDSVKTDLVIQRLVDGDRLEYQRVQLVHLDKLRDLAILKLEAKALPALSLAQDDDADSADGSPLVLIGFPIGGALGFNPVSHTGIVSSRVRSSAPPPTARQLTELAISRVREGSFDVLQLDATAYPGNSGGPVINAESGKVIGIVSMVLVKGGRESALSRPSGISYAVPVRYLRELNGG